METRIALFANHQPGLEVAKYLSNHESSKISVLYLPDENKDNDKEIQLESKVNKNNIYRGNIVKDSGHIKWFRDQKFDAIICVYWPWLLKKEIFSSVKTTLNFHPAFLPINRGWFPHVHSLIDGSKAGVTLHQIADGADTGSIWIQEEEKILPNDTAKSIYLRLQEKIVKLFIQNWDKIIDGEIQTTKQDESLAIYRPKKAIEKLDFIDINQEMKVKNLINLLRARSFGDLGFAYIEENNEKVFLNLRLSKESKFK